MKAGITIMEMPSIYLWNINSAIILQLSKSMDVDSISDIFLFFLVIHFDFFFVCVSEV